MVPNSPSLGVGGVTRSAMQWISIGKNTVSREVQRTMLGLFTEKRNTKQTGFS